ncbi:MAG: hypothetical protein JSS72_09625 [Armatimonadetes bacterium]|nr:hypothetical protein [Armatimonadota bacterium]
MTSDPISRYLTRRRDILNQKVRLRSMNPGEINDMALSVYRHVGPRILRHTFASVFVSAVAMNFLFAVVLPQLSITSDPNNATTQIVEFIAVLLGGLIFALPLYYIGAAATWTVVTSYVSDFMLDAAPSDEAARLFFSRYLGLGFRTLVRSYYSTFGLLLLSVPFFIGSAYLSNIHQDAYGGLLFMLAVVLCIGSFIFFMFSRIQFFLAVPVAIVEGLTPKQALKRSKALMGEPLANSVVGNALGICFLGLIVMSAVTATALGIFESIGGRFPEIAGLNAQLAAESLQNLLPTFIGLWIVLPIWSVCSVVFYYRQRVVKEGLDIEVLAREVWKHGDIARFEL